jgi:hypothetical protein
MVLFQVNIKMLYALFGTFLLALLKMTTISNSIILLISHTLYTFRTPTYYTLHQMHGMEITKLTIYRQLNQHFSVPFGSYYGSGNQPGYVYNTKS